MASKKNDEPWYFKYLRRELSKLWGWDPERKKAKLRARLPGSIVDEKFRCEKCGAQPLTKKEIQIDHIVSRESTTGWDGWSTYIERTFCPAEGLQVLCKPCHNPKSAKENASRRAAKKGK